jgi:hypothetical protein
MTEVWLLFDEAALRRAAGNPNGRQPLALPRWDEVDGIPDPKELLADLMQRASGRSRRRPSMTVGEYGRRVADLTADFAPLRRLSAFAELEDELAVIVREKGWGVPG